MKIQELIVELQKLADSHPDAELLFEWAEHVGFGIKTTTAGFVYAKSVNGCPTVRIADLHRIDDVRDDD